MKIILFSGKATCVDADTEFFNGYQWKKLADYCEGEKVLQYNKDGTVSLVLPIQYIKQPTKYLWHFKNTKLDQCLSGDHEVYYITNKNNLYHKPFFDVMYDQLNTVNGFSGRFITSFKYDGSGIDLTDNEIKLMCAIICDGTFPSKATNNCFLNIKKQRKKDELRKILKYSNVKWHEKEYKSMPGYTRFYIYAPRREKEFTEYWYNCNNHQLQIICNNVIKWDGHYINKNSFSFSTTSKQTADFIQFAFTSCGYRANLRIDNRVGEKQKINGKFYIRKSIYYEISISKNVLVSLFDRNMNKDTYFTKYKTIDGYSYCFTVESGMLVLRRNNKIFITGNCGKDYTANILKRLMEEDNKKVLITHYADLLKYICKTYFEWNGDKDDKGRSILQRVGTDTIRKQNPDYWVKFVSEFLKMFPNEWDYCLIPDARFPNEIRQMLLDGWDVFTVRVNRLNYESPLTAEQQNHISETALDGYQFDYYINSESGLDKLETEVKKMYENIKAKDGVDERF